MVEPLAAELAHVLGAPPGELDAAVERVRSAGVEVYGPVEFDAPFDATSYYFYDPDGNLLEFFSPRADARRA